jgi:hypothetical protein
MSETTAPTFDFTSFVLNPYYSFVMYGKRYNYIPQRGDIKNYNFLYDALRIITNIEDLQTKQSSLESLNSLIVRSIVINRERFSGLRRLQIVVSSDFEDHNRISYFLNEIESNLECADEDYAFVECYNYEVIWHMLMIFVLLSKNQSKISNPQLSEMIIRLNMGLEIINNEMSRRATASE